MGASKVGVREFRAGLADFVDSEEPVAVTRHGHTVGYFLPVKPDRAADVAAQAARVAGEQADPNTLMNGTGKVIVKAKPTGYRNTFEARGTCTSK